MAIEGNSSPPPAAANGPPHAAVSLRGAGRVQRRVWRAFMTNPDREMTTADLVRWCYPRWDGKPLRKQRHAIRRAAARVATRVRVLPGGVVFRAFVSKSVSNAGQSPNNCESDQ